MKRGIIFHFHTIVITLVLAVLCSSRFGKILTAQGPGGAAMPDFNEMFKNFDFEKFVQELDAQLADIEKEEAEADGKPSPGPISPRNPMPMPAINKPSAPTQNKTANPTLISDNPVELITNPPMITAQGNGKSIQIPHKDAEKALIAYVQTIIDSLNKIDQAALSSHGEEFHEYYLSTCGNDVTNLVVSLSMLISKRAYRVAVLAPPKELAEKLKTYRKNIITVHNKLMKLAADLIVHEADEISEEEHMRRRLAELAQVNELLATPQEPSTLVPAGYDVAPHQPAKTPPLGETDSFSKAAPIKQTPAYDHADYDDYDDDETLDKDDYEEQASTPPTQYLPSAKQYASTLDTNGILDDYQQTTAAIQSNNFTANDDNENIDTHIADAISKGSNNNGWVKETNLSAQGITENAVNNHVAEELE